MKPLRFSIFCVLFLVSTLYLPKTFAQQDYTQWHLPEGAKACLGKGRITGAIAFSPDGTRLAVGSAAGVWIYDAKTYQELALLTGKHEGDVSSIAFSPDSAKLASTSWDTLQLWDIVTGEHLKTVIEAFRTDDSWGFQSVAFSPDGEMLASGSGDGKIHLWDTATGKHLETLTGHTLDVTSLAFNPDGRTLASGGVDRTVRLWDVSTREPLKTFVGHTGKVNSIAFSPDGRTLVSGSTDRHIVLWGLTGSEPKRFPSGHAWAVRDIAFSPDGRVFASCGGRPVNGSTISLWDAVTGEHLKNVAERSVANVSGVAFSRDGQTLAGSVGFREYTVRLWDVPTGAQLKPLTEHASQVTNVALSPDGDILASVNDDNIIRLWDVATRQQKRTLIGHDGHDKSVNSIVFSPDGKTLASSADRVREFILWDVDTGARKTVPTEHVPFNLVFSPDGRTLAGTATDKTVRLWDVATGQIDKILTGHTSSVMSVAFSPDGKMLASGDWNSTIRLWDVATGEKLKILEGDPALTQHTIEEFPEELPTFARDPETPTQHTTEVTSLAFSPNGDILASRSQDQSFPNRVDFLGEIIILWDVAIGQPLGHPIMAGTYRYTKGPFQKNVVFSPDGRVLAYGAFDTIVLWDVTTGEKLKTLSGHTDKVSKVAISRDGRTLASASHDGTVLLWDVALTPPEPEETPEDLNHDGAVNIQDLVLVASNFGKTEENDADVNDDGIVNIQDLVLVAAAIGG